MAQFITYNQLRAEFMEYNLMSEKAIKGHQALLLGLVLQHLYDDILQPVALFQFTEQNYNQTSALFVIPPTHPYIRLDGVTDLKFFQNIFRNLHQIAPDGKIFLSPSHYLDVAQVQLIQVAFVLQFGFDAEPELHKDRLYCMGINDDAELYIHEVIMHDECQAHGFNWVHNHEA
ncbi:OLC1v1037009C1 [Oldenlandia corymbosa var. corymbosa]|uniref:OLC1v1037009C1 n=1 Tax=Oldenlandia corymbosa var. corymbosa TaxID=529605 RepID=A0AAV1CWJ8_OLDCO|nr:OLC1v1037009C1 [Oldenlandia corymbosa var. corymbosa]